MVMTELAIYILDKKKLQSTVCSFSHTDYQKKRNI